MPVGMPDLDRIADLCQRCIGVVHPGYFGTRLRTDPTILPDGVFVEEDGGRPVSTVTAHRFALRFGEAVVTCGGIANVATGFIGGMAGCAMIGQSVINIKSGGRTRLSSLAAGVVLLFMVVFLVPV